MKVPQYTEIRKTAPISYRPAEELGSWVFAILDRVQAGAGTIGVVEAFDKMTQERVAVLVYSPYNDDDTGAFTAEPFAIMHNGNLGERLVPCCEAGPNETDEVRAEEWDKLPCYTGMKGN